MTALGIEERARASIRGIVPCDLSQQEPLSEPWARQMTPLDCIFSSLTLENVAHTREDYGRVLNKFAEYLRPGGGLILVGVLNESSYNIGENEFFCFRVKKEMVKSEVEKAGFHILQWDNFNPDNLRTDVFDDDAHQAFFLSAVKEKLGD